MAEKNLQGLELKFLLFGNAPKGLSLMKTEFFNKAQANLAVARMCLENGFYDACANRAYYAAFQAAIAALAERGIKRDKIGHGWVQAEFSEKLIKRQKIYPAKVKSYLMEMQIVRDRADYKSENISEKQAVQQINRANEMIALIQKELKIC